MTQTSDGQSLKSLYRKLLFGAKSFVARRWCGGSLDDSFLRERIREIIKEYDIQVVFETGTNAGQSTIKFAEMAPRVIGCDVMGPSIEFARARMAKAGIKNVELYVESSPELLKRLMPTLPDQTLYFLDAHWGEYWPLLDEIDTIRRGSGVILIHDVKVPGKDFGYDSYEGRILNYEYVKDALTRWSPTHRIEYNEKSDHGNRGALYVFPK